MPSRKADQLTLTLCMDIVLECIASYVGAIKWYVIFAPIATYMHGRGYIKLLKWITISAIQVHAHNIMT